MKVFAVYDKKVEAYLTPFIMKTKGEAIRSWVDVVNDKNTQFNKHPEDFSLCLLAEFDEVSGKYENRLPGPDHIATALEYVDRTESEKPLRAAKVV